MRMPSDFATRRAALKSAEDAAKAARDTAVANAKRAEAAAHAAHAAAVAEAREAAATAQREREIDVAADARKTLAPIAAAFGDAPRSSARAFAEQYARLDARAIAECGEPLNKRQIAYAFAAAHGCLDRMAEINEQASSKAVEAANEMLGGATPAIVEDRLRACELAVLEHVRFVTPGPHLAARADALASRATPRGAALALEELDTARRANAAAAAPPPPAPRPAPPPASIDEDEEDEAFARDLAASRSSDGPLML